MKQIAHTVLSTSLGIQNLRWLPGSHIAFPIRPKKKADMYLPLMQHHTKYQVNCSNGSPDRRLKNSIC